MLHRVNCLLGISFCITILWLKPFNNYPLPRVKSRVHISISVSIAKTKSTFILAIMNFCDMWAWRLFRVYIVPKLEHCSRSQRGCKSQGREQGIQDSVIALLLLFRQFEFSRKEGWERTIWREFLVKCNWKKFSLVRSSQFEFIVDI